MIRDFFKNLCFRFKKENDLSDITWTMCKTSEQFQLSFLNFFFPGVTFDSITSFEREYSEGDSRPDFYIKNGNYVYLIEVKIYDENHHFGQYEGTFGIKKEQLGYITNYPMKQDGYKIRTWDEFYDYLLENLPDKQKEKVLWKAYLDYLKNVCGIMTKKMNLGGMYSLYEFYSVLGRKVLNNNDTAPYNLEPYASDVGTHNGGSIYGGPKDGVMGKYFKIKYTNTNPIIEAWGWIGVYFKDEHPLICICFENNQWGKPICNIMSDDNCRKYSEKGIYYSRAYYEDGHLWFDLSVEKHKEFSNASDINSQIAILKSFVDEVVRLPLKLLQSEE